MIEYANKASDSLTVKKKKKNWLQLGPKGQYSKVLNSFTMQFSLVDSRSQESQCVCMRLLIKMQLKDMGELT